ncbi:thioredoxin-like protein [Pseudomassariella vexata]|uniref:Thioredoxin-like protein n=1 Tax=Pseudomassariella vexata TaxID=1141098 RepID=A0A1Y2DIR7_9PEZI|nr:thioredoxin-like protein [Pseudomassariella vexata]ORY59110.1 thioredoxin-like protein [Pseudomassariella vexata]
MGGRIEIFLDIASLYSYVAFTKLQETRPLLEAHGVEVDIKPVLLGGINAGSGNKPPWTLPAKAAYGRFDVTRSKNAAGLSEISPPDDLMSAARTMLPLRALHYIKLNYPLSTYLTAWHYLFHMFWAVHRDMSSEAGLAVILGEIPVDFGAETAGREGKGHGEEKLFGGKDVEAVVRATQEPKFKELLKGTVAEALARGAFGAPWLWVTNGEGKSEPFFGSDRWYFVYDFLGLPYQKMALLPPRDSSGAKSKL